MFGGEKSEKPAAPLLVKNKRHVSFNSPRVCAPLASNILKHINNTGDIYHSTSPTQCRCFPKPNKTQLKRLFITFLCSAANTVCDKEINIYFHYNFNNWCIIQHCWNYALFSSASSAKSEIKYIQMCFYSVITSAVSWCVFAPWGVRCLHELVLAGFKNINLKLTECVLWSP